MPCLSMLQEFGAAGVLQQWEGACAPLLPEGTERFANSGRTWNKAFWGALLLLCSCQQQHVRLCCCAV